MKRIGAFCFSILLLAVFSPWVRAEGIAYSWYCVHAKDHVQPCVDQDLAFVEECGGYYIDHAHTNPKDEEKVIYLTFDAGYENGNVARILDVLKEEQVPAAFFILGHLIEREPDLVRRMAEEGHLVCNHTVRHKDMTRFEKEAFGKELTALNELCQEKLGLSMACYYRPPEGRFSKENLEWANALGYKTIFWSFAYPDWDNARQIPPEKAKRIILDNAHNGEVMLLHPTSDTNATVLREVIRTLRDEGYRFGTLDELTGGEGAPLA